MANPNLNPNPNPNPNPNQVTITSPLGPSNALTSGPAGPGEYVSAEYGSGGGLETHTHSGGSFGVTLGSAKAQQHLPRSAPACPNPNTNPTPSPSPSPSPSPNPIPIPNRIPTPTLTPPPTLSRSASGSNSFGKTSRDDSLSSLSSHVSYLTKGGGGSSEPRVTEGGRWWGKGRGAEAGRGGGAPGVDRGEYGDCLS
jgi:hypothetical protein